MRDESNAKIIGLAAAALLAAACFLVLRPFVSALLWAVIAPIVTEVAGRPASFVPIVLLAFGILAPTPRTRTGPRPAPRSLAPAAMVALGAGAALTEAATMVPYLAGTAIISGMEIGWPVRLLVLAGYCLVMILPALVLIGLAGAVGDRVWPRLERFIPVLEREARTTLLWIAAIAGGWMAVSSWGALSGG